MGRRAGTVRQGAFNGFRCEGSGVEKIGDGRGCAMEARACPGDADGLPATRQSNLGEKREAGTCRLRLSEPYGLRSLWRFSEPGLCAGLRWVGFARRASAAFGFGS